jgi:hypothetical protein
MSRDRYVTMGTALLASGALVLATSLLLLSSHPGIATGMAMLVLGLVILLLGKTATEMSPELASLLVRTGEVNLGRLLEEVGLQTHAVYLPSSLAPGGARALIPLDPEAGLPEALNLNDRLVVFYGDGADDAGLLVAAPGCLALELLPQPPGPTVDEMQVSLTRLAVATLAIARGVDIHESDGKTEVRFDGEHVPPGGTPSAVERSLGSLSGSIAAALVAEARGQAVTIESEAVDRSTRTVTLVTYSK